MRSPDNDLEKPSQQHTVQTDGPTPTNRRVCVLRRADGGAVRVVGAELFDDYIKHTGSSMTTIGYGQGRLEFARVKLLHHAGRYHGWEAESLPI